MTKNAKARNEATEVKAPEVKENNVDPALVKEIDKDLGVLAGTGEQPYVGVNCRIRQAGRGNRPSCRRGKRRSSPWQQGKSLAGFDRGGQEEEETEVASVYLDIPLPVGRRRYSKRREEYKDWPVGKAVKFNNYKTNPVNAVLYPLVDDGYKFQSQKQGDGTEPNTSNYIVWRVA